MGGNGQDTGSGGRRDGNGAGRREMTVGRGWQWSSLATCPVIRGGRDHGTGAEGGRQELPAPGGGGEGGGGGEDDAGGGVVAVEVREGRD